MDQELKEKWVDALRSGRYEQGQGLLRTTGDRYCCLGVLVDIADPDGWEQGESYWYYKGNARMIDLGYEGVLERVIALSVMEGLAAMNDDGRSFDKIAAWIEENL